MASARRRGPRGKWRGSVTSGSNICPFRGTTPITSKPSSVRVPVCRGTGPSPLLSQAMLSWSPHPGRVSPTGARARATGGLFPSLCPCWSQPPQPCLGLTILLPFPQLTALMGQREASAHHLLPTWSFSAVTTAPCVPGSLCPSGTTDPCSSLPGLPAFIMGVLRGRNWSCPIKAALGSPNARRPHSVSLVCSPSGDTHTPVPLSWSLLNSSAVYLPSTVEPNGS